MFSCGACLIWGTVKGGKKYLKEEIDSVGSPSTFDRSLLPNPAAPVLEFDHRVLTPSG